MTLVVCWKSEDNLSCAADTRLSSSGSTISDAGGKIFVVPVTLSVFDDNSLVEKINYTLGFAFCGSTLLANNSHVIASNCTQLFRSESRNLLPDVETVAKIYAKSAEYVTRDTNSRLTTHSLFQGMLFGYCPVKEKFCLYLIEPILTDETFSVEYSEIDLSKNNFAVIGSGKDVFLNKIKRPNSAGNPRSIIDTVYDVMEEDTVKDVGGHPQIMEAREDGVSIVPILAQSRDNLDQACLTVNGFEVENLGLSAGLRIGSKAVGFGVEKIAGRNALRAKGIDPDSEEVTKELQNLASFESCLLSAYKLSKTVCLDDNYTLETNSPKEDTWYFSAKCKKCRKSTPLFLDPSSGEMGNPFVGNGAVKTRCFRCKTEIKKKATGLYSKKWNGA